VVHPTDQLHAYPLHKADHQLAHHLLMAAPAHMPPAIFVLEPSIRSLAVTHALGRDEPCNALRLVLTLALRFTTPSRIGINDRHITQAPAVRVNLLRIVRAVHQIVQIPDAMRGHRHQGNGGLTVMQ